MAEPKSQVQSADWTRLLADPDLLSHLGVLLQTYRDAPPEKREEALVVAMREIKKRSAADAPGKPVEEPMQLPASPDVPEAETASPPIPQAAQAPELSPELMSSPELTPPPFEPDIFTPSWGQDRRKYPRMKCFVAVEVHVNGSPTPVWGNLSNTSMGGCFVESVTPISSGAEVEIGLWVSSGKIWVKGMVLNGVVTKSSPSFGIRVKFSDMQAAARESLRQFLKFVESTTKGYERDNGYLAQLKR